MIKVYRVKGELLMAQRAVSHGLGFGDGSIIDYGGGVIEYRQTGKLMRAFRVNVGDITGFTVRKRTREDKKTAQARFNRCSSSRAAAPSLRPAP